MKQGQGCQLKHNRKWFPHREMFFWIHQVMEWTI